MTVLQDEAELLPLHGRGCRVYAEGLAPEQVARLGEQVKRPEDADVAVVHLQAPFEPRSALPRGVVPPGFAELPARRAVLTPLLPVASVLTAIYSTTAEAYVDPPTGVVQPRGRLPFDLPGMSDALVTVRVEPSRLVVAKILLHLGGEHSSLRCDHDSTVRTQRRISQGAFVAALNGARVAPCPHVAHPSARGSPRAGGHFSAGARQPEPPQGIGPRGNE